MPGTPQAGWGDRVVLYPRRKADFTLAPIIRRDQLARSIEDKRASRRTCGARRRPPFPGRGRISRKWPNSDTGPAAQITAKESTS